MRYFIPLALIVVASSVYAQTEFEKIDLPSPQITGGRPLMEVLNDRQSTREFSSEELPLQTLSNLLWAAFGVNRPESGGRTAPSAYNMREIDIYMAASDGLFLYEPVEHCLLQIHSEDIREDTGSQGFTQTAPVNLIYVVNYDRMMDRTEEEIAFYAAVDLGFISQNVYLFCASEGLATVVLAWINYEVLTEKMDLPGNSRILLSQPIGYLLQ